MIIDGIGLYYLNKAEQEMDETEKYLNSILEKRLGSVINYGSISKNGQTVTRLVKKQQQIQTMPTVFRKKHETVYIPQQSKVLLQSRNSQIDDFKSVNADSTSPKENHRVEYMAISKRIEQKNEDNFISPTVDVTSYRKSKIQNQPESFPTQFKAKLEEIKEEDSQINPRKQEEKQQKQQRLEDENGRVRRKKIFQ